MPSPHPKVKPWILLTSFQTWRLTCWKRHIPSWRVLQTSLQYKPLGKLPDLTYASTAHSKKMSVWKCNEQNIPAFWGNCWDAFLLHTWCSVNTVTSAELCSNRNRTYLRTLSLWSEKFFLPFIYSVYYGGYIVLGNLLSYTVCCIDLLPQLCCLRHLLQL